MTLATRPPRTGAAVADGTRVRAISRRPAVYAVLIVYTIVSTVLMLLHQVGVTAEHAMLIALVLFSVVAPARPFVWDWLPFLGAGVMFADVGTMIDRSLQGTHTLAPIVTEQTLLGGNVAAVWLQAHVRSIASGLDVPLAAVYLSFFAAPVVFALWLWLRRRTRFGAFVAAYIVMMGIGFLVHVFYPETPPWLAARDGVLPYVDRVTVSLLNHLGGIGHLYAGADPAPYGAMPALHVAVPSLIACTAIAGGARANPWRWLWLLYPLTMAFATLYLGEHYLLDALAGLALGALCFGVTAVWTRRHRLRPALARATPRPLPTAGST